MKKAETQEQEFLEVCSSYDHDLLTGKKEMTLKDYERITYLVSSLGYSCKFCPNGTPILKLAVHPF